MSTTNRIPKCAECTYLVSGKCTRWTPNFTVEDPEVNSCDCCHPEDAKSNPGIYDPYEDGSGEE